MSKWVWEGFQQALNDPNIKFIGEAPVEFIRRYADSKLDIAQKGAESMMLQRNAALERVSNLAAEAGRYNERLQVALLQVRDLRALAVKLCKDSDNETCKLPECVGCQELGIEKRLGSCSVCERLAHPCELHREAR